jgi:amino acid transporter
VTTTELGTQRRNSRARGSTFKRLIVGRPLASSEADEQRLPKRIALAIFSSDPVSSTAYGPEAILTILLPAAGLAAYHDLIPISLLVLGLLVILVLSYRQTIFAYPNGGGSYIVSRENLGTTPSLVAAASLLVDYTLTVAVSVAAGAAAIMSAIPSLRGHPVALSLGIVTLIMLVNLRGLRASGRAFAVPVYSYVVILALLIIVGLVRYYTGSLHRLPPDPVELSRLTHNGALLTGVTALVFMKAFSSGAITLSGVEAISNGVPAFRPPEPRNASITLMWAAALLGIPFLGLSVLSSRLQPTLSSKETLLSILGDHVFSRGSPLYIILQASTAAILALAANTAFADFPRLSSIVARDGFLPQQLYHRGDRLVFSNGIIGLATVAGILLAIFRGNVISLIPLYAVGLFTAFTLSQAGMVRHHLRLRESGWGAGVAINALGAATTGVVLAIVVVSKFTSGAWIPVIVIPLMVLLFKGIKHHYDRVNAELALQPGETTLPVIHNTCVVPINQFNRAAVHAIAYAQSCHPERLVAVHVGVEEETVERLREGWRDFGIDVPLEIVPSPYREFTGPILDFLDELDDQQPDDVITVIIPEVVVHRWWEHLLHNQSGLVLKARLHFRPNTVVVSVPTHVEA